MPATPSPLVLINASPQINGVNVTKGTTVTVTLGSNAGVYAWDIFCIGTDELTTAATVNATLSIDHAINSATFTMPNYDGSALIFKSIVNNGVDINGVVQPGYTTTFGVYTLVAGIRDGYVDGYFRVAAQNETTEGDATYGWISKFNPFFRNLPVVAVGEQIVANIQQMADGEYMNPNSFFIAPDNSVSSLTVHTPFPPPPVGTIFVIGDVHFLGAANPIHIDALGLNIDGSNLGYTITTNNGVVAIMYYGNIYGWKILWEKV